MASAVVGVVGGSGGAGASTFAAALAVAANGPSVLVDLDVVGGGIDVALGLEATPGARWSGLQLDGGHLDPQIFERGLLRWGDVRVLADPRPPPSAEAIEQVLGAAREVGTVVVDAGRAPDDARTVALGSCDLVIIVSAGTVTGLAAARRVCQGLPSIAVGAVLRRGSVRDVDAAELLGVPVLATLPDILRQDAVVPQAWQRIARGVLGGLVVVAP